MTLELGFDCSFVDVCSVIIRAGFIKVWEGRVGNPAGGEACDDLVVEVWEEVCCSLGKGAWLGDGVSFAFSSFAVG